MSQPLAGWKLLVAAFGCAALWGASAFGQAMELDPPPWQPFRDATPPEISLPLSVDVKPASASNLSAGDSSLRTALLAPGEVMMCPEPFCDATGCGMSCYLDGSNGPPTDPAFWQWRLLPTGVIWQSYWAGVHESRMSGTVFNNRGDSLLDVNLGGRAALLRYGTDGPGRPHGLELQIEGAGTPRLNLDENWDVDAVDFRFGVPLVYGRETWQTKFSYYHLSSHMGDEYAIRNQAVNALDSRINFSRDVLVWALSYYPLPAWRWYAEAGWAFRHDQSEPWEFQFGVDVAEPGPTDYLGTPFIAINGHIREELDYGGNVVFQAGWLWRGEGTQTMRLGFHYYNGKSNQFEFYRQFEEQIGAGLWYDF